jgi:hypothetical protein
MDIYDQRRYVGQKADSIDRIKLGIREIDRKIEKRHNQIDLLGIERHRAERDLAEAIRLHKLGLENLERMEAEAE